MVGKPALMAAHQQHQQQQQPAKQEGVLRDRCTRPRVSRAMRALYGAAGNGTKYSERGQDIYLDRWVFSQFMWGSFLELGANQGVRFSNALHLEESHGWHGICVEANPDLFQELARNRPRCININMGISRHTGEKLRFLKANWNGGFLDTGAINEMRAAFAMQHPGESIDDYIIDVPTVNATDLLGLYDVSVLELLLIDIEGHELAALEGLDFDQVYVWAIVVEANEATPAKNKLVHELLVRKGFELKATIRKLDKLWINTRPHPCFPSLGLDPDAPDRL
eukprot:m51a1_g7154 hypothetical protein (280) ;mRNA; r:341352-342936